MVHWTSGSRGSCCSLLFGSKVRAQGAPRRTHARPARRAAAPLRRTLTEHQALHRNDAECDAEAPPRDEDDSQQPGSPPGIHESSGPTDADLGVLCVLRLRKPLDARQGRRQLHLLQARAAHKRRTDERRRGEGRPHELRLGPERAPPLPLARQSDAAWRSSGRRARVSGVDLEL